MISVDREGRERTRWKVAEIYVESSAFSLKEFFSRKHVKVKSYSHVFPQRRKSLNLAHCNSTALRCIDSLDEITILTIIFQRAAFPFEEKKKRERA